MAEVVVNITAPAMTLAIAHTAQGEVGEKRRMHVPQAVIRLQRAAGRALKARTCTRRYTRLCRAYMVVQKPILFNVTRNFLDTVVS